MITHHVHIRCEWPRCGSQLVGEPIGLRSLKEATRVLLGQAVALGWHVEGPPFSRIERHYCPLHSSFRAGSAPPSEANPS